ASRGRAKLKLIILHFLYLRSQGRTAFSRALAIIMKKITTILIFLVTSILMGQEYYQIEGTEKIISTKDSIQIFLNKTKDNYNKTSVEKYGFIANSVSYELGNTIKRNDSVITFVKLSLDLKKVDYTKDAIFDLQNKKLPDLELLTLNGIKINNETLNGKVTLINLWFVNCAPCLKEIPELNDLKKEFEKSVNFIAITFDSKTKVIEFLKRKPFDFEIVPDQKELLTNTFKPESYPKILIVDKKGVISFISNGITENESEVDNIKHTITELKVKLNELISKQL
ncbi:TlpA family protein disulfide reductase, partial [Cellulophaga sp. 20_2_10]|uniref:TlpA family protein disulfide reductase n=1 Tax=Cellulophaga sp. 20_2_10 TaxID=2942476 RepID=UPI00201AC83A